MVNTTGKCFSVTSFGSSHGKAIGAVIDGCPANLELNEEDIQKELNKRKPGTNKVSTPRKESDKIQILSGIFEGKTDGTPITGIVLNKDQHSQDYTKFKNTPRPGHGDYGWMCKYKNYDYNGGGRGSGRITIGHVIGGAIAKKLLQRYKIEIIAHTKQIGNIKSKEENYNTIKKNIEKNIIRCGDLKAASQMEELIISKKKENESLGGIVEIIAKGVPAGIGEPAFGKLDGDLAKILMEIGSVKGVEIGKGFEVAQMTGSQNNDEYTIDQKNKIKTTTNNSGGIIGGISNGMPIIIRVAIKPTPSISKTQNSINLEKLKNEKITIKGRHDPCIAPRVTTVTESSVAIIIADHMIRSGFIPPNQLPL